MGVEYYKGKPIPLYEIIANKGTTLKFALDGTGIFHVRSFDKEGNDKGISQLPT